MVDELAPALARLRQLVESGQYEAAREYGLRLFEDAAPQEEVLQLLGLSHYATGDNTRACRFFSKAIRMAPENASHHYHMGLALLQQDKSLEALAMFRTAIALRRDFAEAYLAMGNSLMGNGQPAEAVSAYLAASRFPHLSAKASYNLAMAYLQLELRLPAIQALQQVIAAEPNNASAFAQLGLLCRQQGDLPAAARALQAAADLTPERPEILEKLGDTLLQLGEHQAAIPHYRKALNLQPESYRAMNNLGLALLLVGRADETIALYQEALNRFDTIAELHFNLGNALMGKGRKKEAADAFRNAIRLKPNYREARFNLGVTCQKLRLFEEAAAIYRHLIDTDGPEADTLFNLALVQHAQEDRQGAIAGYEKVLELAPTHALAHYNLGIALSETGRLGEAIARFRAARDLDPNNVRILNNLGLTLYDHDEPEEAESTLLQAITLKPDFAEAHSNLGNVYQQQGRSSEAMSAYQEAVTRDPLFARGYYNQGCLLMEDNNPAGAIAMYRKAIELEPDFVEAHWNLSNALLLQGELAEGFREYRWRWRRKNADIIVLPLPEWHGETRPEATLLIIPEQGKGDTIQFLRYLPHVKKRVGRIVFVGDHSLSPLLSTVPAIDLIIPKEAVSAHCAKTNSYVPLLNLPEILGTTQATIPAEIPYLRPDPGRVETFRPLFDEHQGQCKVGLVWRGNPNHNNDRNRSCPAEELRHLSGLDGISLFSLQLMETPPPSLPGVIDLAPLIASFADTAAIMPHLDLVISVDTATAHLAGALGRPVWTLLPWVPDWRWMLHREDSPWYPTMRIFRQQKPGDWPELFARVRTLLIEHGTAKTNAAISTEAP